MVVDDGGCGGVVRCGVVGFGAGGEQLNRIIGIMML